MIASPVMVVGGAGFLGAHVSKLMADEGLKIVSFDLRSSEAKALSDVAQVQGNLLDQDSIEACMRRFEIKGVVHLVAQGNEAAARQDPKAAITLNVQGTLNLLEASRKLGIAKFVYVSTAGVYGKKIGPIKELEPITWRGTVYHPSHYMGEVLVEMYHEVFGLDGIVLRPLSIYGPSLSADRPTHLKTKSIFLGPWLSAALRGEAIEIKNSDTQSDITYVKDVAKAVGLAYSAERIDQRIFNISSGSLVTHRQIAEMIQKHLPGAVFKCLPGAEDNPLRPTRGPLDISKAKTELRFEPEYDLERGIKEFTQWLKEGRELS